MCEHEERVLLADNVRFRYESRIRGGLLFIYNIKTQKVLVSNKQGHAILKRIKKGFSVSRIISDYARERGVNHSEAMDVVNEFIKSLLKERLVINISNTDKNSCCNQTNK